MEQLNFTPRAVAFLVVLTLSILSPAFALRTSQPEHESQRTGLEEALRDPDKALRQFIQRVTTPVFPSSPAPSSMGPAVNQTGLEEEAAQVLGILDAHFRKGGAFHPDNSKVYLVSHGRINRVYRIERNDGQVLIGFKMNPIWRFSALDRNHSRFELKQKAALAAGVLPKGWKQLSFLDRADAEGPGKFYQDEKGDYWRFMPFTEGRVIQAIDEIPPDKRLAATKRFGRLLVQFRRMLEMEDGGTFEDTLPNFQNTAYHLDHYDRVLRADKDVEPALSEPGKLPPVSIQQDRLEGSDTYGDFAERNRVFQEKVARYRAIVGPALGQLRRVVTHGDPKVSNVFWEVDQDGEWIPLAMGDLDTLQPGHETLDLADALRVLSFVGGESADPENLVILRDVVEALIEGWLEGNETAYGKGERDRLEPYTYLSVAAIYFTVALRFYDSFLTGDSYFERLSRYDQPVSDPGKYLRAAEIQMAQAEAFMREFSDKPGMAELTRLAAAGLEERMPAWLKGLATPEELEGWIHRGHEALLGLPPVAVLFDPGLVPAESDEDGEELLMEMEGYIRSLFALPEEIRFRVGLRSARGEWEGEFRIIEVVRHLDAGAGAVPIGALPLVITEALASPRSLFYVDPLVYAGLKDLKLPDALADLTGLFA